MAPAMNPIDYYIPVVNRGVTIRASSITCMFVAWAAVSLRLWSRWKLVHALGWDDFFVSLAACWALFGCITLNNEIPNGLGLHEWTIVTENPDGSSNYDTYRTYFMWFYLTNVSYAGGTTCIKLSLLFQYLRLFPRNLYPIMFRICLAVIAIVTTWGVSFLFLIIFACSPVDKSWNLNKEGKCIMFGDFHPQNAYAAYASQTASNMFLDTLILIVPIPMLYKLELGKKSKLGLVGLFTAGSLVVTCASLRLWLVVKSRAGTFPTVDPPWYAPPIILMSVLEINLAMVTASMPIFWPYLASLGTSGIKVMQEVIVRSEPRKAPYHYPPSCPSRNNQYEDDDDTDAASLGKQGSAIVVSRQRSNSDASDTRLAGAWDDMGGGSGRRRDSARGLSQYPRQRDDDNYNHNQHPTSSLPYDAERHRQYYGDPTVAELVLGDLMGPGSFGDAGRGGEQDEFLGAFDERCTGNQAAAWFEPEPVALEELGGKRK